MRRLVSAAAGLAAAATLLAAPTALARICWTDVNEPVDLPPANYPCPGPQDQPVPAPVWIATDKGPGYNMAQWDFVKIRRGSQVFFANTGYGRDENPPAVIGQVERFHGTGFDSGWVAVGGAAQVQGVPQLAVGTYCIYDGGNICVGHLIVEP